MPKLTKTAEQFILHWGEMGTRWGINRTVAQIHALLYLSPEPLNAEDISKTLSVARSNVSTSLRELQSWGLVKIVHILGDRRDHFESMKDVWEMFQLILSERKRREIDPTLSVLRQCVKQAKEEDADDPVTRERLEHMLDFFETMTSLYKEFSTLPPSTLRGFAKLKGRMEKLLVTIRPSKET
ncbi:MAG TPA: MarR family transcriptional regulator [Acidobacteriota bacterium]|nr:MarR family transcriptional regulator [Acidobacteriota bacterium]